MSAFTFDMFEEEVKQNTHNIYLVHTSNGHYKYYIMTEKEGWKYFECKYGRIWASPQYANYLHREGMKKYAEKIAKGYRQITNQSELEHYLLTKV